MKTLKFHLFIGRKINFSYQSLLLLCLFTLFIAKSSAQDLIESTQMGTTPSYTSDVPNELAKMIDAARGFSSFNSVNVFQFSQDDIHSTYKDVVSSAVYLDLSPQDVSALFQENRTSLSFAIPVSADKFFELELTRVVVLSSDFNSRIAGGAEINYEGGRFYRGIVKGNANSIATLSVFNDHLRLLIGDDGGDYVLGKLNQERDKYILYNDKKLLIENTWACGTDTNHELPGSSTADTEVPTDNALACVPTYYVVDKTTYDAFLGNTTTINNWLAAMTNEVATVYQLAGIVFQMGGSLIYNGTITDPTTNINSTSGVLEKVGETIQNNFTGRLVHWVSSRSLGGGVAWLSVLCSDYYTFMADFDGDGFDELHHAGPYAVSASLGSSITPFPTYSWEVEVVAHEAGHNFGSPHTQGCNWNDTNTAIDGCVAVEGGCARPATPSSGTIMSYCHLVQGVGIDFNNGWAKGADPNSTSENMGPYQRIRARYNACNKTVTCSSSCQANVTINASNNPLSGTTSASATITHTSGTTVTVSGNAVLSAPTVTLNPGFSVTAGNTLEVNTTGCTALTLNGEEEAAATSRTLGTETDVSQQLSDKAPGTELKVIPNPFTQETGFYFNLEQATNVTIQIYSVSGQLAEEVLANQWMEKGLNMINYTADNLKGGMFYVLLKAGKEVQTKKMIIIE